VAGCHAQIIQAFRGSETNKVEVRFILVQLRNEHAEPNV
jgi:hypothetical protein